MPSNSFIDPASWQKYSYCIIEYGNLYPHTRYVPHQVWLEETVFIEMS